MTELLIINSKKSGLLKKLIEELKYALSDLSSEELKIIFLEAAKGAGKSTYEQKKRTLASMKDFTVSTYQRYKNEGIITSLKFDGKRIDDFARNLPSKMRSVYDDFLSQPRDKQIEIVASLILTAAIFFAAGGGLDFEGGAPDSDIAIAGIDAHRSVYTHSIIIGLTIEFAARFGILTLGSLHGRLPEPHHHVWDRVFDFMDNNKDAAIAAMWFGIGIHLLKDSGILVGGVKPVVEFPNGMPIEAHQGWFAANGLASSVVAGTR